MWKLILAIPDIVRLIMKIIEWVKEAEKKSKESELKKKVEALEKAKTPEEIRDATRDIINGN